MTEHSFDTGMLRLGIDLGGTKVEIVALAGDGGETVRRRLATPAGDYPATIATIACLVRETEAALAGRAPVASGVGIGIPGTISPATGVVKNANSTWLNGRPLERDLREALARPVRIANDANCFALSEAADGAASGARTVFGVIIGTGVGGAIVVDGQVLRGANAIAGEWGHNPLPWPRPWPLPSQQQDEWPGPACWCGRRGCIETFLSGPALARDHAAQAGRDDSARLAPRATTKGTTRATTAADIAAAAEQGDPAARASIARYADRLARALATVVNIVDPDTIVLGGGLSGIAALYEAVPRLWGEYVFSDRVDTRLVPPRHGDSSGVRGAARLWAAGESEQ